MGELEQGVFPLATEIGIASEIVSERHDGRVVYLDSNFLQGMGEVLEVLEKCDARCHLPVLRGPLAQPQG